MFKIVAAKESYEGTMILKHSPIIIYSTIFNISSQDPVCVSWPAIQTAVFLAPVWLSQWPVPRILCTSEQRGLGECQHPTRPGGRGWWTSHSRSHWEATAGRLLIYWYLSMGFWYLVLTSRLRGLDGGAHF